MIWRRGRIRACGGAWGVGAAPLKAFGAAPFRNALASNALIDLMLVRAAVLKAFGAAPLRNALASNALIDLMLVHAAVWRPERCKRVRV